MSSSVPRFLVASIGNPAPYTNTPHSAGHLALTSLQTTLESAGLPQSRFARNKHRYLQSDGPTYTLIKSPSMMNVSGVWLNKALKQHLADNHLQPHELALVVVHDELELGWGATKARPWKASHRGHNGIKSILASLRPDSYPGIGLHRIGIGIDRPVERTPDVVARYVLKELSSARTEQLLTQSGPQVFQLLQSLKRSWEENPKKGPSR